MVRSWAWIRAVAAGAVLAAGIGVAAAPRVAAQSTGAVLAFGSAVDHGSPDSADIKAPLVSMAADKTGNGYWVLSADGGIYAFGDAPYFGTPQRTFPRYVAIVATGIGYLTMNASGGVQSFGGPFTQSFRVSMSSDFVSAASTLIADPFWAATASGRTYSTGFPQPPASLAGVALNSSIVGMAATPSGKGYWLAGADGGVFAFGDASFLGSKAGVALNAPIVGMAATPSGKGYWLAAADGGVFAFGDAPFAGSAEGVDDGSPVTAIAAAKDGKGYWLLRSVAPMANKHTPVPLAIGNCQTSTVRPTAIVLACADGYAQLIDIKWTTWSVSGAHGTGMYLFNDCSSGCVSGEWHVTPATIDLSDPVDTMYGTEFTSAMYRYVDPLTGRARIETFDMYIDGRW